MFQVDRFEVTSGDFLCFWCLRGFEDGFWQGSVLFVLVGNFGVRIGVVSRRIGSVCCRVEEGFCSQVFFSASKSLDDSGFSW